MAYLTTIPVPEETTALMKSLNFVQVDAIAPNIQWTNLKGISVLHHSSQTPRTIDDAINMIYSCGINVGSYEQSRKIERGVKTLVEQFVNDNRLVHQEPIRADSSLSLKLLCAE